MKLSIGELEKLTGMNRTALRYYDAEGVLDPQRQENGYRMYSEEDVMSLVQLKQRLRCGTLRTSRDAPSHRCPGCAPGSGGKRAGH